MGRAMSELTGLLRDLRIALRRAVPGFEHQPLSRRLDAAIEAAQAPPGAGRCAGHAAGR